MPRPSRRSRAALVSAATSLAKRPVMRASVPYGWSGNFLGDKESVEIAAPPPAPMSCG